MTRHAYPLSALVGDYLRAAVGLFPTIAVFVIVPVGIVGGTILGALAALFAVFGIQTALRHCTCIEVTEVALRSSSLLQASISWNKLNRLKLAYYSTRRPCASTAGSRDFPSWSARRPPLPRRVTCH